LTFLQLFEGGAFNFRRMEEQIVTIALNESETLTADQLLDSSLWHCCTPLKKLEGRNIEVATIPIHAPPLGNR
jgi:hypothetical protein